jgi:hypothetical protein
MKKPIIHKSGMSDDCTCEECGCTYGEGSAAENLPASKRVFTEAELQTVLSGALLQPGIYVRIEPAAETDQNPFERGTFMSRELLDLKDQLDELGNELLLASEYARAVIEKETQLGKRTEQGFASITDRFFDKLNELWAFLGEVEKGRNYKPLEADLIGFCSHQNCRYDSGPVKEYNHCLECPSRYTKGENS